MTSNSGVRLNNTSGANPTLVLPGASLTEVAAGRLFVREQTDGKLPARTSEQMQLATSELVSNALMYGKAGPIVMTVHVSPDAAWVRIANDSPPTARLPPVSDWAISGSNDRSGRGLGIVKAVSDQIQVEREGERVAVTACFALTTNDWRS